MSRVQLERQDGPGHRPHGLMTAAITYVLSIYPLTSQLSSAARTVQTQADGPVRAAELVVLGGGSYLQSLQERLISVDEDTQRFPFLYYFRASDPSATLHTFIRGAAMVCLPAQLLPAASPR